MEGTTGRDDTAALIVIVEDSAIQAKMLQRLLLDQGYAVTVAQDGAAGLAMIQEQLPSLIISDIMMPIMNGYEMSRKVKDDARLRDIPLLLLTELTDVKDIIRGFEARADCYVTKPYCERYLLAKVEELLSVPLSERVKESRGGLDVLVAGERFTIDASCGQIFSMLVSTYENAIEYNRALLATQIALRKSNDQLTEANRELEAFAYSASHDLQAPLRAIDGFSAMLLRDYTAVLDEKGRDSLGRVCGAAKRMGKLIEDLLQLSRISRTEVSFQRINLSKLVQSIAAEFQQAEPKRHVEFVIAPGVEAYGDLPLLRIMLENLLGNAWKFTAPTPQARIEFGTTNQQQPPVYFVRDNGAGFDMAQADKLFLPFQRLHPESQFSGTGIGLSIVQRIVQRLHGGQIWGEGEVNKGAAFFLTLPTGEEG